MLRCRASQTGIDDDRVIMGQRILHLLEKDIGAKGADTFVWLYGKLMSMCLHRSLMQITAV